MTLDSEHTKKTLEALSENIIGKVYFQGLKKGCA
jgi:hypothetical protein